MSREPKITVRYYTDAQDVALTQGTEALAYAYIEGGVVEWHILDSVISTTDMHRLCDTVDALMDGTYIPGTGASA